MSDVKIQPENRTLTLDPEKPLWHGLTEQDVYVRSGCGGNGKCGECVIKVLEVHEELPQITAVEEVYLGNVYHITKERLSCQWAAKYFAEVDLSRHNIKEQEARTKVKNQKKFRKK